MKGAMVSQNENNAHSRCGRIRSTTKMV